MRALVLLAALLPAVPAAAQPAPNRRAIAVVPSDGSLPKIVAVATNAGVCEELVQRLNIGAAAPPEDNFRFVCTQLPVEV